MSIDIAAFVAELQRLAGTNNTTEHSFRPALATLLDSIADGVHCINEPQAITNVGRPDFVLQRANGDKAAITVGHVEAKDIDLDISPKAMKDANKKQFERYTKALPNLIYTNGLDFAFYKNGEKVREISIGDWLMGVRPKPENYEALANQLRDFAAERLQTITSAETLAEMMAGKAVLIKDVLFNTLREDKELSSELAGQYSAFKEQLIHDLDQEEFADIYAETIAYGMFAARLHDETLEDFTREEALNLLPKSNPFLRKLFEFVAGQACPKASARRWTSWRKSSRRRTCRNCSRISATSPGATTPSSISTRRFSPSTIRPSGRRAASGTRRNRWSISSCAPSMTC